MGLGIEVSYTWNHDGSQKERKKYHTSKNETVRHETVQYEEDITELVLKDKKITDVDLSGLSTSNP